MVDELSVYVDGHRVSVSTLKVKAEPCSFQEPHGVGWLSMLVPSSGMFWTTASQFGTPTRLLTPDGVSFCVCSFFLVTAEDHDLAGQP